MQASTCPVAPAGTCRLQEAASRGVPAGCLLPPGAAGCCRPGGQGAFRGSDTCTLPEHQRGPKYYSRTVKPSVVIKISFLRIKYLSGNMSSGCEDPGLDPCLRTGTGVRARHA